MTMRKHSDGTTGEALAMYWFQCHGWKMFRTQPATRVVYVKGRPIIINCGKGGIADFTGYYMDGVAAHYRACEVKEVHDGHTMPASRLSKDQRAWMAALPRGTAYVCCVWMQCNPEAEVFPFVGKGTYTRGTGLI